ncbi:MAG: hypothetical protein JO100_09100 [Pseudonocardia sp.]|nr:hypothetical protein [Pseudonocardia sp.]
MSPRPPGGPQPGPSSLPPSPWVLVDTTTVDQAADALARLETWLTSGDPAATAAAAHTLSGGEDDPAGVARWVGTLAEHLPQLAEEVTSWP